MFLQRYIRSSYREKREVLGNTLERIRKIEKEIGTFINSSRPSPAFSPRTQGFFTGNSSIENSPERENGRHLLTPPPHPYIHRPLSTEI